MIYNRFLAKKLINYACLERNTITIVLNFQMSSWTSMVDIFE